MKPVLKISASIVFILIALLFIQVKPNRMVYGYFACDCAPNGFCSKMFSITNNTIGVDSINFCQERKFGVLFNHQPQIEIKGVDTKDIDHCKMAIPLIMFFDPRSIFGCPDCLDGGGTYMQFSKWGITRHFEFDQEPFYFAKLKDVVGAKINFAASLTNFKRQNH